MRVLADACETTADGAAITTLVDALVGAWNTATAAGPINLNLTDQAVLLGSQEVFRTRDARRTIPGRLRAQGVSALELHPGLNFGEARRIVEALNANPEDSKVDFALRLWEAEQGRLVLHLEEMETRDVMLDAASLAQNEADASAITQGIHQTGDPYSLRRALIALHRAASQTLSERNADAIELVCHTLARHLAATGDLDGVISVLDRSQEMIGEANASRVRVGKATLAALRDHPPIVALFDGLERKTELDARPLAKCLQHLGAAAAMPFVQWLSRTKHHQSARKALRVMGPDAERILVQLYLTSGPTDRSRLRAVLMELGTHDALASVAVDFDTLNETTRIRIVELGKRSLEPEVRNAVIRGLHDKSGRVRRAALLALMREDAPAVAASLPAVVSREVIAKRANDEVRLLFDALARIGDAEIANHLVDLGRGRGLRARFRKPNSFQARCLRALSRMTAPDAREVVNKLRDRAPRAVCELLEAPFEAE